MDDVEQKKDEEQILISIIVPVYNIERYLAESVDSILRQTYRNLEILLVDDGSTDRSGIMCDQYAQKDARIRVIHQKNQGLSGARNTGLDVAQGEWIGFVDSDDWIEPNMYEILLQTALEYRAEIVNCGFWQEWKNHTELKNFKNEVSILENSEEMIQGYRTLFGVTAWSKLYHKSFWEKGIRFEMGRKYEDTYLLFAMYQNCKRLVCINHPLYHYRQRKGSLIQINDSKSERDKWDARRKGFDAMWESLSQASWQRIFLDCYNIAFRIWCDAIKKTRKERKDSLALYEDISFFFNEHVNELKKAEISRGIKFCCTLFRYNCYMSYLMANGIQLYLKMRKRRKKKDMGEWELYEK